MKQEKIKVVVKNVGECGKITEINNELEVLQKIVGGYIEIYPFTDDIILVCNEEGKLMDLDLNFSVPLRNGETEYIVGNVLFVSSKGSEFGSLTDDNISFLKEIGMC